MCRRSCHTRRRRRARRRSCRRSCRRTSLFALIYATIFKGQGQTDKIEQDGVQDQGKIEGDQRQEQEMEYKDWNGDGFIGRDVKVVEPPSYREVMKGA